MAKVAKPAVEIRPTSVESAKAAHGELVIAWARDIETGEPRYIGEIDADHRGGKCSCEWLPSTRTLICMSYAFDCAEEVFEPESLGVLCGEDVDAVLAGDEASVRAWAIGVLNTALERVGTWPEAEVLALM